MIFSLRRVGDDQGFVALLTCIMISLLLLVITVSLITLEALQLRKAEDSEQTLRAYYTAEAGVEDAVSKVLAMTPPYVDQTCAAKTTYDVAGAAGWTCQQIKFSGSPTGKLEKADEAKTIDPGPTTPPFSSVTIEWSQSTDAVNAHYNVNPITTLPNYGTYTTNFAVPPIELSVVQYPNVAFAANNASLKLQNVLLMPNGSGAKPAVSYASFPNNGARPAECRRPTWVNPIGGNAYNCFARISGFDPSGNLNYLFRIRTRYLPAPFKMTFFDAGGTPIDVPDGTATIDVTAKAGQTYRRVISKLPLTNGAAAGLNYVMYSDTDICKNFSVLDNVPQAGCPY